MSSYLELIRFEYNKILRKKSTIITLVLGIILTALISVGPLMGYSYINGEKFESNYEGMKKDREYIRALSGREINKTLLAEAIEAYSNIPLTGGRYTDTDEYQKYARPYSEIYYFIRLVYGINSISELTSVTGESLDCFYEIRQDRIEKIIESTAMSPKEKAYSIDLSRKVNTPFIYSYTDGYKRFFTQMYVAAFLACFVCTVCISPIFAGEYADRMDGFVFSSRYGRNRMIGAKLFTGITFTVLLCLIITVVSYITVMAFFGWDGADSPVQFYFPLSIVPYSMGEAALLYSVLVLSGNMLSSSLTMFLSSKLKSPFAVIVIMTAISTFPLYISVSDNVLWVYHLLNLIPVRMFSLDNITGVFSVDILGLVIRPFGLIISFAAAASIVLVLSAYRSFRKGCKE